MRCVCVFLLAIGALAQELPLRNKPGMAFDSARNRLVVFGGFGAKLPHGDTWEWDGAKWQQASTSGPSARAVPAMAYDSKRKKVVLFGGVASGPPMGDTWEWDGREWTLREIPGPPARSAAEMVYETGTGRMVLFGGWPGAGTPTLADTWVYDGEQWTEVQTPGPPGRLMHTMAHHEGLGVTVLFGGSDPSRPVFAMGDTWSFDGKVWRQLSAAGPMGRDHHAMAYDAGRRKVVMFGGGLMVDRRLVSLGDTCEWDNGWTLRTDLAAPGRSGKPGMAYDPKSRQLWLYGGWNDTGMIGDLWRLDGSRWRPAPAN